MEKVYEVLAVPVAGPVGTLGVVMVSKLATTFFGAFMVIEVGLVDPERSPDQFWKV